MALRDWLRVRPRGRHIRRTLVVLILAPPLLMGVEALLRARLQPLSSQAIATRVYARPPVLAQGGRPDRALIEDHLLRQGYRRTRGQDVGIGEYYLGSRGWVIGQRGSRSFGRPIEAGFAVIRLDSRGRISRMEDEDGDRLRQVSLEPELLGRLAGPSIEDRLPVRLEDVPDALVAAVLTVEDQRFFEHSGLDYRRIAAAFVANFKAGRVVQGGSTLTQQLVKNLYLSPKRSVVRKAREAMMAVTLEGRHTKEEILQAYLNHIYLGQDGAVGIHGVGRAAEHFFGKDVTSLDLAESALLVALIRAPSLYSPFRNPETALSRRNLVLRLMRDGGSISEKQFLSASEAPLDLRKKARPIRSARYFMDYLADHLPDSDGGPSGGEDSWVPTGVNGESGEATLPVGAIVTTLDARLQRGAEKAVKDGLARLERDFDWLRAEEAGEPLQAALVALDPRTGEILAMVGGREYGSSQFNRAVHARRQPGSAFKPVVALAALARPDDTESGSPGTRPTTRERRDARDAYWSVRRDDEPQPDFTLASTLEDEPLQVETPVGVWQPANYDRNFSGTVTLREALERSLNVPFARLGLAIGPERIVETARDLGIESPLNPYPSIALGASEVSPLELTRAFGVLAAGGFRPELKGVSWDGFGSESLVHGTQVYDAAETFLVTSALRGAVDHGTGQGIRNRGFYGDVAAKSGTTNDFRDGWFVGYTPNLVVGVWVGFDHGRRLELPGAGVALPIFADFLKNALGSDGESGPWGSSGFSRPAGLEVVDVDSDTGLRGGWGCGGEPELFLRGTAPEESCRGFRLDGRTLRILLDRGEDEAVRIFRRLLSGEGRE